MPDKITLTQNYSNPFNPFTQIRFALPKPDHIKLKVLNILGQEVVTLVNDWRDLGYHEVLWEGKDKFGNSVSSGMYFSVLITRNHILAKKMVLLK